MRRHGRGVTEHGRMGTHWGSKSERSSRLEAAAEKRETRRGDAQREKDKEREKDQRATRENETRLRGIVEGQDKACEKQGRKKNQTGKDTSAEEVEQIFWRNTLDFRRGCFLHCLLRRIF